MTLSKPPLTVTLKSGVHQNSGLLMYPIRGVTSVMVGDTASIETGDRSFAKLVDAQLALDSAHCHAMSQQELSSYKERSHRELLMANNQTVEGTQHHVGGVSGEAKGIQGGVLPIVGVNPYNPLAWQQHPLQGQQLAAGAPGPTPAGIDATLAERGSRYGEFPTHAQITQTLKDVMRGDYPGASVTNWLVMSPDMREALEMIAHKIGRILNGDPNYHDSWHDIVGYAKLVADRLANGK